jgi:hypothetical protein
VNEKYNGAFEGDCNWLSEWDAFEGDCNWLSEWEAFEGDCNWLSEWEAFEGDCNWLSEWDAFEGDSSWLANASHSPNQLYRISLKCTIVLLIHRETLTEWD